MILKVALGVILGWIIIQNINRISRNRKRRNLYKLVDLRRDEDK